MTMTFDFDNVRPSLDGRFFASVRNGGAGSGNFGHAGRPGKKGGSSKGGKVSHKSYSIGDNQVAEWEETSDPIYPDDVIIKTKDQIGRVASRIEASIAQTAYAVRDGRITDLFGDLDPNNPQDKADMEYLSDYMKKTFKLDDKELDRLMGNTRGEKAAELRAKYVEEQSKESLARIEKEQKEWHKNGGKGSGNFGHSGRPGKVGGSGTGSGAKTKQTKVDKKAYDEEQRYIDYELGKAKKEGRSQREALKAMIRSDEEIIRGLTDKIPRIEAYIKEREAIGASKKYIKDVKAMIPVTEKSIEDARMRIRLVSDRMKELKD